MGGNGSGRRKRSDEEKRHRIIDKAWDRLEKIIDDSDNKYGDICAKDVSNRDQRQEIDTHHTGEVNIMGSVTIDGKDMEIKIGDTSPEAT